LGAGVANRAAASDRARRPLVAALAASGLALVLFAATGSSSWRSSSPPASAPRR
jgi:hypothetical protein